MQDIHAEVAEARARHNLPPVVTDKAAARKIAAVIVAIERRHA